MHPERLAEIIRRNGVKSRENLQIADRLRSLLPELLRDLRRGHSQRGARAERHALTDDSYLEHIRQYLEVYGEGLAARVQNETHRMLWQARQSIEAYSRAAEFRRQKIGKTAQTDRPSSP